MTFDLLNNFSMDVKLPDGKTQKLKAYFREFTKDEEAHQDELISELKAAEKKAKKLQKQIKRLKEKNDMFKKLEDYEASLSISEDIYELEDELEEYNSKFSDRDIGAETLQYRFETCLGGKDADIIMDHAKTQGYIRVFDVIRKSIQEANEKNS